MSNSNNNINIGVALQLMLLTLASSAVAVVCRHRLTDHYKSTCDFKNDNNTSMP